MYRLYTFVRFLYLENVHSSKPRKEYAVTNMITYGLGE